MQQIELEKDGVVLTIKKISLNKVYTCKNDCYTDSCSQKATLSLKNIKSKLVATEVLFNVRNSSSSVWKSYLENWSLIDDLGYAFRACELCDELHPPRIMSANYLKVASGTQVDFLLLFPEFDINRSISKILLVDDGVTLLSFEVNEMSPSAKKLFVQDEVEYIKSELNNNWNLKSIDNSIDDIELKMFSRLNNVIALKESVNLENKINNEIFHVRQKLQSCNTKLRLYFENRLNKIANEYEISIINVKESERKYKEINKRVSQLYELTPIEFEEYIAELLKVLMYEKITLTPASNDKGVDIFAEKKGMRIAVQCKKYKGVVGSPDIQKFIGSMQHAEVQKGLFFTTGTFSVEAEKMAQSHPIELYDKVGLTELINSVLNDN